MATSITGLNYRLTTGDDLEAIKSISTGLNPELDYIVETYSSLLKDPLFFGAIAEINGEPIAFGVGMIQMEGRKVYNRSARVKPEWRNKGILGCLKKFLRETLRDSVYPQMKYEEFSTHDTNPAIQKIKDNPQYAEVYRAPFLTYCLSSSPQLNNRSTEGVDEIGMDGIRFIMENENLCQKFFPARVFVGFVDFEPFPSELELIRKHQPFVLASSINLGGQMSQLTIGVKVMSKSYVIHWILSPDTDSRSVASSFKLHLRTQFQKIQELNNGGTCVIVFPNGYREIVETTALELGCSVVKAQAVELIGFRREF